jgi:hypothetical protein
MALKGSLIDMSLVDLLQVFGMSAKTGRLMLDHTNDLGGMIWIAGGRIANAAVIEFRSRNTVLTGENAVIEMLQWEEATFRFIPALPNETYQVAITRPNEWLILEGLRRRDEQVGRSLYPQVNLDTRLRVVAQPSSASERLNLNHDEWSVLTHCANAKTIEEVLAATGYPESEMFAILGRLMALRLIDLERDEIVPVFSLPPSIVTADLAHEQV